MPGSLGEEVAFIPPHGSRLETDANGKSPCVFSGFFDEAAAKAARYDELSEGDRADLRRHLRAHALTCDCPGARGPRECPPCRYLLYLNDHEPAAWVTATEFFSLSPP